MCCGDERGYIEMVDNCAHCGREFGARGEPKVACSYAPVACAYCGSRPCDMSC